MKSIPVMDGRTRRAAKQSGSASHHLPSDSHLSEVADVHGVGCTDAGASIRNADAGSESTGKSGKRYVKALCLHYVVLLLGLYMPIRALGTDVDLAL